MFDIPQSKLSDEDVIEKNLVCATRANAFEKEEARKKIINIFDDHHRPFSLQEQARIHDVHFVVYNVI